MKSSKIIAKPVENAAIPDEPAPSDDIREAKIDAASMLSLALEARKDTVSHEVAKTLKRIYDKARQGYDYVSMAASEFYFMEDVKTELYGRGFRIESVYDKMGQNVVSIDISWKRKD